MRTWFGSFCDTEIFNSRQPGSLTEAAPFSLSAARKLSIWPGTTSYSTALIRNGPDCAKARWPWVGSSTHAVTKRAITAVTVIAFNMTHSSLFMAARLSLGLQAAVLEHSERAFKKPHHLRDRLRGGTARLAFERIRRPKMPSTRDDDPAHKKTGLAKCGEKRA